jgi:threonine dehydrogenase-like Zn-dependent dehydrogenase
MKALRFIRSTLSLDSVDLPNNAGEALVRVTRSGICNTDLEIIRGYAGFEGTLGHEFVGIVEESADLPQLIGRRVVGEINAGCGECDRCIGGDPRHCPRRTVLGILDRDGSHAEFLQLPAGNLYEVPDSVNDRQAVFAEPLAAAIGITERVEIEKDSRIVVIGDGKLGLLCAMVLALHSTDVIIVGKHIGKIRIAEKAGVQGILLDNLEDSMKGRTDIVVEASGSASGFATALDLVKPRGKIVLKSTFHGSTVWPATRIVVDEITVVGSRCGRIGPAIKLLETKAIDVEQLIDGEYPLADALDAVQRAAGSGALKILLRPD